MTFTVTALARASDSPTGRVDGIDGSGRTIELEVPSPWLRDVRRGTILRLELTFETEEDQRFRELRNLLSLKG